MMMQDKMTNKSNPDYISAKFYEDFMSDYLRSVETHIMANVPVGVDPRYYCELEYTTRPPHIELVESDAPGQWVLRGEIPKVVIKVDRQ